TRDLLKKKMFSATTDKNREPFGAPERLLVRATLFITPTVDQGPLSGRLYGRERSSRVAGAVLPPVRSNGVLDSRQSPRRRGRRAGIVPSRVEVPRLSFEGVQFQAVVIPSRRQHVQLQTSPGDPPSRSTDQRRQPGRRFGEGRLLEPYCLVERRDERTARPTRASTRRRGT